MEMTPLEKKKKMRKIITVSIGIIMALGMVLGMVLQLFGANKPSPDAPIIATVEDAHIGSRIKVEITDIGKELFNEDGMMDKIESFQVFYEDGAASAPSPLGEFVVSYPPKKAGENIIAVFLDAYGEQVQATQIKLTKE